MILRFEGVVEEFPTGITIGGRDIIKEIANAPFDGKVTVAIGDERFHGDLDAWEELRGYNEWTPGEPATITVGHNNILRILEDHYNGEVVTMWVADEPVNTLEGR